MNATLSASKSAASAAFSRHVPALLRREAAGAHLEPAEAEREIVVDFLRQPLLRVVARTAGRVARQPVELAPPSSACTGWSSSLPLRSHSAASMPLSTIAPEPDAAPEIAAVVHPPPQLGDVVDRLADQDRLEELDDRRHRLGAEVAGVRLADAGRPPSVRTSMNAALRSFRASRRNGSFVDGPVSRVVRTSVIFMAD